MKTAIAGMFVAFLAVTTGCTKSSDQGGRAGEDTFKLVAPAMAAEVKQGEVQTVRVQVERGTAFKQGVKLETKAPAGITVEPADAHVKPEDKGDIQLKITAAKDAPLGEHTVQLKGTPDKGDATTVEIKIKVTAK